MHEPSSRKLVAFHMTIQTISADMPIPHPLQLRAMDEKSSELSRSVLELTATNSKQAEEIGRLKLSIKEGEKAKRDLER